MAPTARSIFVFDSPRTCSQLFNKLTAVHPQLIHLFHPMIGASMYGPENVTQRFKNGDTAREAQEELLRASGLPDETYTAASDRLTSQVAAVHEQGKIPWIKDHAYCVMKPDLVVDSMRKRQNPSPPTANPTALPDHLFWTVTPIILIRHPAQVIPSYHRTQHLLFHQTLDDDAFQACSSLRWARIIFDAYRSHNLTPLVLDAADLLHDTSRVMTTLCQTLDLDPSGVQYTWDPVPPAHWPDDPIMRAFFRDLLVSTGVLQPAVPPVPTPAGATAVHLRAYMPGWSAEFGAVDAEKMYRLVEADLADFGILYGNRLR